MFIRLSNSYTSLNFVRDGKFGDPFDKLDGYRCFFVSFWSY